MKCYYKNSHSALRPCLSSKGDVNYLLCVEKKLKELGSVLLLALYDAVNCNKVSIH
jgi:hypothetical protein